MRSQLLSGRHTHGAADAVTRLVGVQAQAAASARLAVRARTHGLVAGDVDAATRSRHPTLVRTWAMRGTLHMVAAEDLPWLVSLLGPLTIKSDARRRAQLGLSDQICQRALEAIAKLLTKPLTRAELLDRLNGAGVAVSRTGQAPPHLLMFAACSGLICRGPDLDGDEPTYVLVDSCIPAAVRRRRKARDEALRDLAQRYLTGYGPATSDDLAAWSGLPRPDARAAIERLGDNLETLSTDLGSMVAVPSSLERPTADRAVQLLGAFDTLLLGYRTRDLLLDPRHAKQVQAGGMIAATVLVDGKIVGTWKLSPTGKRLTVMVSAFDGLPRGAKARLETEAEDVGRFLGLKTSVTVAD